MDEELDSTLEYLKELANDFENKAKLLDEFFNKSAKLMEEISRGDLPNIAGRSRFNIKRAEELTDRISRACYRKDDASREELLKIVKDARKTIRSNILPRLRKVEKEWESLSPQSGLNNLYHKLAQLRKDAVKAGILKEEE